MGEVRGICVFVEEVVKDFLKLFKGVGSAGEGVVCIEFFYLRCVRSGYLRNVFYGFVIFKEIRVFIR